MWKKAYDHVNWIFFFCYNGVALGKMDEVDSFLCFHSQIFVLVNSTTSGFFNSNRGLRYVKGICFYIIVCGG
jgi:hypothetical protein